MLRKVEVGVGFCDSVGMNKQMTSGRMVVPRSLLVASFLMATAAVGRDVDFRNEIAPILKKHCVRCHSGGSPDGEVDLTVAERVIERAHVVESAGEVRVVVPGDAERSLLLEVVSGDEPRMPEDGEPLTKAEVALLRDWIDEGAEWPAGLELSVGGGDWWSLQSIERPQVPELDAVSGSVPVGWQRNPIDAFVLGRLLEHGLVPSPRAEKENLIRRIYYDLHGLPPSPEHVREFCEDDDPDAYAKLVNQLLDSPRYGERWARHWLDVVHYADTHGYDKDKVREHAWPYRDYVIRALNNDKPYGDFVREQLAGDVLADDPSDGIPALGFIAAGPFDWVGQIEVSEATMEGKRVRNLDRDDMVSTAMNTFASVTAQCARCHNHKFDPITQEDYYRLQAVFAAVDRADREYQPDADAALLGEVLESELAQLRSRIKTLEQEMLSEVGGQLGELRERVTQARKAGYPVGQNPEFGYHSQISPQQDAAKWVQVDLGAEYELDSILLFPCHDTFNNIGAGFGFPLRYKVEVSGDESFTADVMTVADLSKRDVENPGVASQAFAVNGKRARFVRVTALRLAPRQNDFIFALGELMVLDQAGVNLAKAKNVSSSDSIEAPVRWQQENMVDGYYYGQHAPTDYRVLAKSLIDVRSESDRLRESKFGKELNRYASEEKELLAAIKSLPPMQKVYAAATEFSAQGNFQSTGGQPREIFVLKRGEEKAPDLDLGPVQPGALSALPELSTYFDRIARDADETQRRAALAMWLTDDRNPLLWRSIVNRVWSHHFGRGIVDTPNDFGRMGGTPSHPELLDYLASRFRDEGGSLKDLHRLICTSATYQQAVAHDDFAAKVDAENRLLWRANRQRLDAESIRDTALMLAGKLVLSMGGPGFRAFGFKDDHSPHYDYRAHDPDAPDASRRSIYRFIVRSVPDPLMMTLDCADPSISVPKRSETLTSLQALAMLNDAFMVRMAEHFAARVEGKADDREAQVRRAFELAVQREPNEGELELLVDAAERLGMANVCRLIFNLNEFVFVD